MIVARRQAPATLQGFDVWNGLKTPGAIEAKIVEVNSYIRTLGYDIRKAEESACPGAEKLTAACPWYDFVQAWSLFLDDWDHFRTISSSWASRLWGDKWEGAVEYQERAQEWRLAFQRLGGAPTGPDIPDPARHDFPWRYLVYGGLAIGGVFAAAKIIGTLRSPGKEP